MSQCRGLAKEAIRETRKSGELGTPSLDDLQPLAAPIPTEKHGHAVVYLVPVRVKGGLYAGNH